MRRLLLPIILPCLTAGLVVAEAPSMSFASKTVKTTLKPGESSTRITFPFENRSDKAIEIERHAAPCGCIKAEFKDGKTVYAPGEKGEVTAIFMVGNLQGTVRKDVVVWQKGDDATKPSIILTAEIEIPELVSITPKSLNWKTGEENAAKTYRITVHEGETIRVTGVVTTNNHFVPQLNTIAEGKEYEITITPKDTGEAGFGILKITTDSQNPRFRRLQGFATINR